MPELANRTPIKLVQAVYALCLGGSEAVARGIAGALNREGRYACSIYAVDHGGPMAQLLEAERIPYHIFSRQGKLDLRLIKQLSAQLRKEHIQIVHTHHLCQLMYAGVAGRLAGARIVHTEHEVYHLSSRRARGLLRVLTVMTDAVTAVGAPVRDFLQVQVGIAPNKLHTIPNGVDLPRFQYAPRLDRSALGWQDHHVVIGCIARLEPEKCHHILLDAFRRVQARQSHARLLLVGDGSERARLGAQAQRLGLNGSVLFLGERGDIPELLASCDLVTLASDREGQPMAILEAMAAGRPVVATNVGSLPNIIEDSETGLLVPPRDPEALAKALERLIADRSQRQRIGSQAAAVARSKFSFEKTLEEYKALYHRILAP